MLVLIVCGAALITAVWAVVSVFRAGANDTADFPATFSLPLVGYLPFLTAHPHRQFVRLSRTLGPVFW